VGYSTIFAIWLRISSVIDEAVFDRKAELPVGLDLIAIDSRYDSRWAVSEMWVRTLDTLIPQLQQAITRKNRKVPVYRDNLPNIPIYLLLYSCAGGHREFPVFADMDKIPLRFDFDRVFFFSGLNRIVLELHKA
jgi:hypothetical protein